MKKHKIVLFSLTAIVILLVSVILAPAQSQVKAAQPTAKWTYMVYMAGDGNLEHWLVQDIGREFGKVGSNNDVNIVLLSDRNPGYAPRTETGLTPGSFMSKREILPPAPRWRTGANGILATPRR